VSNEGDKVIIAYSSPLTEW